jgi:trans-aconitate methyltransferase
LKSYYNITKGMPAHKIMNKINEFSIGAGTAIELGCGAGRDTIYLLLKRLECYWNG